MILSSPPKHAGEPRDLADRGWHAGPHYRDVAALFEEARERLKPGGRLYVMVSTDTDLELFGRLIDRAGFHARLVHERSILIESFIIYELLAPTIVGHRDLSLRRGRRLIDPRDQVGRQRPGFGRGDALGKLLRFLTPSTSVSTSSDSA